jgi:hypothetical protein
VGPGINCGARKLTWTPRVTQKKKKKNIMKTKNKKTKIKIK